MPNKKSLNYKGVKVNALGIPVDWIPKGKKMKGSGRVKELYYASFKSLFREDAPKNLIVMYDIPSHLKKERDWFRRQLIKFGYVMIQKSVWVGPSPLPKDFLDYAKEIKINDKLVTFKLAKPFDPSSKSHS